MGVEVESRVTTTLEGADVILTQLRAVTRPCTLINISAGAVVRIELVAGGTLTVISIVGDDTLVTAAAIVHTTCVVVCVMESVTARAILVLAAVAVSLSITHRSQRNAVVRHHRLTVKLCSLITRPTTRGAAEFIGAIITVNNAVTGEMLRYTQVRAQTLEVRWHTGVRIAVEFVGAVLTIAVSITAPGTMDTLSAAGALELQVIVTAVARDNVAGIQCGAGGRFIGVIGAVKGAVTVPGLRDTLRGVTLPLTRGAGYSRTIEFI